MHGLYRARIFVPASVQAPGNPLRPKRESPDYDTGGAIHAARHASARAVVATLAFVVLDDGSTTILRGSVEFAGVQ